MTITCRLITETVARSYGVTVQDLLSRRVDKAATLPRHMSWTLAKNLTPYSLADIGRHMGGRDHSSVMHGIQKMSEAIADDATVASNYAQLADAINVLSEVSNRSGRVAVLFHDIDPVEVADRFLEAKFSEVVPSLEAVRALCMGILHYSGELVRLQDVLNTQSDLWKQERSTLEYRLANVSTDTRKVDATLQAVANTVAKLKALKNAETTIHERPARRALEASLNALQTTFERN